MTVVFEDVTDADREALVDFMFAHAPIMMFPLTNLTRYGLRGTHPRAITAWIAKVDGVITDVISISQEGTVFPCCASGDWRAAAAVLSGRTIKGFVGDGDQVTALRAAMGMTAPADLDAIEPAYCLSLAKIRAPDTTSLTLHQLDRAPHDLIVKWRTDYEIETLQGKPQKAAEGAERRIRDFKTVDSHRVLFHGDIPVAMTGFNAVLPEIVQVGGVYTPPDFRGRGYAKAAVALHLKEVAVDGVTEAVLSAATIKAAHVYETLGFERTGDFGLVIYDTPQAYHG